MGKNTYYSIPNRPLNDRLNFVLTNDKEYLKKYKLPKKRSFELGSKTKKK